MKKLITKIIAIVLSAATFLGLVLENFVTSKVDTAIGTSKPIIYNFQDWFANVAEILKIKELTWMPIAQYVLYGALGLAALIVILVVLQFFVRNKALNTIVKVVSFLGIVVGAGSLVVLFLGVNELNTITSTTLGSLVYSLDAGAYIMSLGATLGGVFGFMCTNKIKAKKTKKRRK